MNSVIDRYRRQRAPSPTHCEPKPEPCSTCGMLECLCRPRFFAGQLLTADDLNRLDGYIRGKHRLHNRQLHGWGVVNGLEVSCDVCGPGVVVGCGYALSPCGEDIVVCEPVTVDVCALIKACKRDERPQVCDPPRPSTPAGCEQGDEEWILAIRYSEAPTRGVKPLLSVPGGSCGCSAPGKRGCSCAGGCANSGCACGNGTSAAPARPRIAPVQCEPTVICEGFAFEVYRKPPEPDRGADDDNGLRLNPDSELYKRFECCSELLVRRAPKMPGSLTVANVQQNLVAWHNWVCSFKEYLQIYLSTRPGYNCELLARLNLVTCPPLNANGSAALIVQTAVLLFVIWLDALLACFCSALLPPCPPAQLDERVPLASIRVSGNPCRVLSICNWTRHRKFATTFPSLQYWLGILPYGAALRDLLDRLCCFQIAEIFTPRGRDSTNTPGSPLDRSPDFFAAPRHGGEATAPDRGDFATAQPPLYERATRRLNPSVAEPERLEGALGMAAKAFARGRTPLDPQSFVESVFLADRHKGEDHLSALELRNLPQFFALQQVLRPMATAASSLDALGPVLAAFGGPSAEESSDSSATASDDIAALKTEMAELRADLARQAEELERFKASRGRRKEK